MKLTLRKARKFESKISSYQKRRKTPSFRLGI